MRANLLFRCVGLAVVAAAGAGSVAAARALLLPQPPPPPAPGTAPIIVVVSIIVWMGLWMCLLVVEYRRDRRVFPAKMAAFTVGATAYTVAILAGVAP